MAIAVEEEKVNDLKDFSFDKYRSIVPTELHDTLTKTFDEQEYGWKKKARIILRLRNTHEWLDSVQQELVDACEGRSTVRTPKSKEEVARTALRNYISSLDTTDVEKLCNKHSVSFTSFMSTNDHTGLVEALVDEMLVQE